MASSRAILTMFSIFEMAGIPQPKRWAALDNAAIIQTWTTVLAPFDDRTVVEATRAFVSGGQKFWPSVGELAALMPKPEVKQLAAGPWVPEAEAINETWRQLSKFHPKPSLDEKTLYASAALVIHDATLASAENVLYAARKLFEAQDHIGMEKLYRSTLPSAARAS